MKRQGRHLSGVTLLELLVAVIITGLVVGFALSIFQSERDHYRNNRVKIKAQADAREAMRIIEQEMRNAGLKMATSVDSRGLLKKIPMNGAYVSGSVDSGSIKAGSTGSGNAGDSIAFVQYQVDPATGRISSISNSYWVRYKLSGDTLYRIDAAFESGLDNPAASNRVPFLREVVAFQVQYGIGASDTALWNPATPLNGQVFNTSGGLSDGFTSATLVHPLTGWTNGAERKAYTQSASTKAFTSGTTYLIQFRMLPNAAFVDTNTGVKYLRVGLCNGSGAVADKLDSTTVPVGWRTDSRLAWTYLTPKTSGNLHLFFSGTTLAPTGSPSVTISDISVTEAFPAHYTWVDNPSAAQKNLIRAVRVWLLARSKEKVKSRDARTYVMGDYSEDVPASDERAYVLYQRIIPVVNNGI